MSEEEVTPVVEGETNGIDLPKEPDVTLGVEK